MRVLAQIQWCETHGKTTIVADDPAFCVWGESIWESLLCVVVDAQVIRKDDGCPCCERGHDGACSCRAECFKAVCPDPTDPTPRPYKQCSDCGGKGKTITRTSRLCSVEPKQTVPNTRGQHDDQPRRVMKPTLFADHVPDEIHSERKYWMNARAALRVLKPILPKRCPEDEALHDLHDPLPHKKCGGRGWLYPDPPEGFNETYGDIAWTLHCRIIWRAMGILNE